MTSRTKLWALSAGALALSLALAGCGGGGGSGGSPAATNTGDSGAPPLAAPAPMEVSLANVTTDGAGYTEPTATGDDPIEIDAGMSANSGSVTFTCAAGGDDCTVMVAADGMVTSTGGTVTAMNSTAFQASLDEADALSKETALRDKIDDLTPIAGAVDTADSALKTAKEASEKIGTEASDGDSKAAMDSAAMVLKAKSDLQAAIKAAEMARTEAMDAKDALGEDGDADVIDTLEAAIEDADAKIADAQKILDATGTGSLASYVNMVTGGADADPQGTPTSIGEAVAKAVAVALGPKVPEGGDSTATADGAGYRVVHDTDSTIEAPSGTRGTTNPVAKANKYEAMSGDPDSMTWEQIVGSDNVMKMRIATAADDTDEVDAASFAGMPLSAITASPPTVGATIADGAQFTADTTGGYKGIAGTVFCAGSCEVETVDGTDTLTGDWYFTPTSTTAIHKRIADNPSTTDVDESAGGRYEVDTLFATYGHWLVVDDGEGTLDNKGQVHVITYAYGPTGANPGNWGEAAPGTPDSEQAVYTGMAAGRSVHKVSNTDVAITETHSGRFTATVELTAKFGATAPMLGGTVSGFMSDNPDAVDEDWTVTLKETGVESATGVLTNSNVGVTEASGQDGEWSAHSYGLADVRPAGIYGGFTAHFTDGHVAGAYATRND